MVTRWSRLALAAILACGVSPGLVGDADADDGDAGADPRLSCPCSHDQLAGSSLGAVEVDEVDRGHGRRHAQPLCARAATSLAGPPMAVVLTVQAPAVEAAPGPREAPWRVAPKTSPPRR